MELRSLFEPFMSDVSRRISAAVSCEDIENVPSIGSVSSSRASLSAPSTVSALPPTFAAALSDSSAFSSLSANFADKLRRNAARRELEIGRVACIRAISASAKAFALKAYFSGGVDGTAILASFPRTSSFVGEGRTSGVGLCFEALFSCGAGAVVPG